jgi:Tfp pilus assembly protein PilE
MLLLVAVLSCCPACLANHLAVIAVSNFGHFVCRASQVEAKTNLEKIYHLEQVFYAGHNRYGSFEEIGFVPETSGQKNYRFRIEPWPERFMAVAEGQIRQGQQNLNDLWTIDETGNLENPLQSCLKPNP